MIEPFFFGPSDQQIFAIYHPPACSGDQVLTVICPPLFNEYTRTHLALREVAISLAAQGRHVLRLDYRGTGDSSGDLADVTIADWVEDIALAVREGREISGSAAVHVVGVRAGALLACRSVGSFSAVQRLVLWDPVPDGAGYISALRRAQESVIERGLDLSPAERRETLEEHAGYRLSKRMLEEFRSFDAMTYSNVPKNKLHIIGTSAESHFPVRGVLHDIAPFACNWETDFDNLLVPRPVLERLISACVMTS